MAYRIRDLLFSLILLVLTSWIFPLICLLLAVSQERVFFRQERTGKNGQPFWLIKFSTLRDIRSGEREEDDQRSRLTPIGRILRRLSLDELPQLWNVLRGDMGLVGPRPLIHEYLPLYSEKQLRRFELRPGITGWAQVKGRNAIAYTARFEYDVWYVENRSLGLDFRIFALTLKQVVGGKGVYVNEHTTAEKFNGRN